MCIIATLMLANDSKWVVFRSLVTWLRCAVIATAVLGFYGSEFVYFLSYPLFGWLQWISDWSLIPLFILSLEALFRFRWKWIATFAIAWGLLFLFNLDIEAPIHWLNGQGFHIYSRLDGNYLSKCRVTDFLDDSGNQQSVGLCETLNRGTICHYVLYDTAAQYALPPRQRTPKWKQAVASVTHPSRDMSDALHLYGSFYEIFTSVGDPGC